MSATLYEPSATQIKAKSFDLNQLAKLKLKRGQLLNFTIQLNNQIEAGKSCVLSLNEMHKNAEPDSALSTMLDYLVTELEKGKKLHESMRAFPNIFSRSYCALVAAGEQGGRLTKKKNRVTGEVEPGTLNLIVAYLKRVGSARQKIALGLLYPGLIFVALILAIGAFAFFVLPALKEVFVALNLDKSFGLMGTLLFGMGDLVQNYYYVFPFVIAGLVVLVWQFWKVFGADLWDEYQLKFPVVKGIFTKLIIAETYSLISALLSAGLTTCDCLNLLKESTRNKYVGRTFEVAIEYLIKGKKFAESLKMSHWLFDGEVYQTIHSAETSGKLDEALAEAAARLYEELDNEIDALVKMIEPACLGIAGIVVGYLLISYYGTVSSALANFR